LADTFDGLKGVNYMNNLSSNGNIEEIALQLQRLSKYLLRKDNMRVLITAEPNHSRRAEKAMESFHRAIEINKLTLSYPEKKTFLPTNTKTYVKLPSSVSFTGQSVLTVPLLHKDSPVLRVASQVISSCYLHQEIREKGGAYGSSASQSMNGVFSFSSYRDPNPMRSLATFENVADWIAMRKFTEKELEEAKLQVFQQLDAPSSPHVKVFTQFIYGITDEIRQRRRNAILDTSANDIIDVCGKYLARKVALRSTAVLGDESNIPDQIRNSKEWLFE
jgi:Zn-dependent M16 (insulinase) family peptidase